MFFDSTLITTFLIVVLGLAALASAVSVGVLATEVARNRRIRLSRHESLGTYYGRLALHH